MSEARPWLRAYPPGVPAEVDVHRFPSLAAVFEDSARRFADRPAFGNLGQLMSFAELEASSRAFAAWCQRRAGLERGDRLALVLPNVLAWPVALFGALRAGLTVVNNNPLYTPRELAFQLADSGARAAVVFEPLTATLAEALPETSLERVVVVRPGDLLPFPRGALVDLYVRWWRRRGGRCEIPGAVRLDEVLAAGAGATFEAPALGHDDVAFLQYTGGTTGVPKAAVLTHGNLCANIEQIRAWVRPVLEEGREVVVTALPLYHIFALTANCFTFVALGGLNYLITDPRDMKRFVAELGRICMTGITGVNTLFAGLLATPGFDQVDFSCLKMALGGGAPIQQAVAERWQAVTGRPILSAYGLTETSPAVCMNPLDLPAFNGKVGPPLPSTEIRICDDEGRDLGIGATGELWVRGPQVMREYWRRPDETAAVLTPDRWLRTGDMAVLGEDGYVTIVERKKDLILVSGFNVYPNEVEDVLATHPKVREVAVVGMPHPRSGEAVRAHVVPADRSLTAEELVAFARQRLARYKVPHEVCFHDELPKSAVGKVLRRALREQGAAGGQRG